MNMQVRCCGLLVQPAQLTVEHLHLRKWESSLLDCCNSRVEGDGFRYGAKAKPRKRYDALVCPAGIWQLLCPSLHLCITQPQENLAPVFRWESLQHGESDAGILIFDCSYPDTQLCRKRKKKPQLSYLQPNIIVILFVSNHAGRWCWRWVTVDCGCSLT